MKRHAARTRFRDVVAEFSPPARRQRAGRVAILCPGMPGLPPRSALMEFLSRKGFWCFAIRYRGTWESGGAFLARSPAEDVRIVMDGLARGFRDAFTGKRYRIRKPEIHLFGGSFGGPAAILNSRDPRVVRVVAVSPVVDWSVHSSEPLPWMEKFVKRAFGDAYRFAHKDWKKLGAGAFYNPVLHEKAIDGEKMIFVHAKDDRVVPFAPTKKFAARSGAALISLRRGGHLSLSILTKPAVWNKLRSSRVHVK